LEVITLFKPFQVGYLWCVARSLCICRASCHYRLANQSSQLHIPCGIVQLWKEMEVTIAYSYLANDTKYREAVSWTLIECPGPSFGISMKLLLANNVYLTFGTPFVSRSTVRLTSLLESLYLTSKQVQSNVVNGDRRIQVLSIVSSRSHTIPANAVHNRHTIYIS